MHNSFMDEALRDCYTSIPETFYYDAAHSCNPISSWYHNCRYSLVRTWVAECYKPGYKIIDIGCGAALWNRDRLPVTGIDMNEKLLDFGKRNGYLTSAVVGDFEIHQLPGNNFDIAVCSEVLEHVRKPGNLLEKISSTLRKSGRLILTVPYDTPLSAWRYLFEAQCFLHGSLLGKEYYKRKCGHINRFSPTSLRSLITSSGLSISLEKAALRMNLAFLAEKI
ncbi:hypothetical protein COT30_03795 [Candidatus Micrarchaeota archaeon CG08_land_8_20_14_0_20_49_17]|nr:MAG: hypothetical protein COT30_03795 [Candidatus Micrarchaeota archaeon CG08_land_8_20_14_0_20_49_17]PIZ95232.1 MAG: hypothetical protein COX84_04580 [Candidatus Micrarchaeota archaeon CG_4_10_14_0_2_um_filter_49_7]